ncbi:MAG TPA: cytidylate kinase-like family protein [Vicinamibacterales bacterium]|nr:cytidylate kinase-like family protein [Vicinamibacterales bacterium]
MPRRRFALSVKPTKRKEAQGMTPLPSLGHAEAYLNIHLSRSGPGNFSRSAGPFVSVSRESGSGSGLFAKALRPRLEQEFPGESQWVVFDRNLVEAMLQARHLSPHIARFLPEDRVSEIDASIGELIGLHPNIWSLIQRTNDMIRELARTGHAVLVGRGANFATRNVPNGVHVRLAATPEFRAARMAEELNTTLEAAAAHNAHTDAARRAYVRSVFQADVTDPSCYDLVINVETVPLDQAVEATVGLLRARVAACV